MGYIYKIINTETNMVYIGQTINNIDKRFKDHCKKGSNCRYLRNAIEKYGKDKFSIELLCTCPDEELDRIEQKYIEEYNTLVPNGYNLREGGNTTRHSAETKEKISKSLLLNTNRINSRTQLGVPHTEEEKTKISESLKKTLNGGCPEGWKNMQEENKTKWIPIIQLDLNGDYVGRYDHSVQIATKINSNKASIHKSCKTGNVHKGFYFMYEKDYIQLS